MYDVIIHECTRNDLDTICRMEKDWVEENITYGQVEISREIFVKYLGRYFLVAEVETEVVGYIWGAVEISQGPQTSEDSAVVPAGEPYLAINGIYVMPGYRDRGIGSRMLDSLQQAARNNGVRQFLTGTDNKDLDRTLRFYRGHGFEIWKVQLFK